jgi:hypothetical protein
MRGFWRVAAALGAVAICAGCPAQAVLQDDAAPQADAGQADAPDDVAAPEDAVQDDAPAQDDACANESPETTCDDGCDNDGDGFVDGDDPDCVPAFLVTREPADGILRWRKGDAATIDLHPGGTSGRPLVDSAQLPGAGYSVQRGMAPGRGLYRFDPRPAGSGPALVFDMGFQASDVCVFQGKVILTELGGPRVHAYDPAAIDLDGGTASAAVTLTRGTLVRACAADATHLYAVVATTTDGGVVDDIVQLDADLNEVAWPGLPTGLAADKQRLLDLAWVRREGRFYGLFVGAEVNTTDVTPFTMGGAAGTPVTAPFALSTLSTFAP